MKREEFYHFLVGDWKELSWINRPFWKAESSTNVRKSAFFYYSFILKAGSRNFPGKKK